MSNISNRGEQSTSAEIEALANLAALGTSGAGQFIKKTGATTFANGTASGSGDVVKVGTPVDNQIGVWTGDGTIEGTAGLTYDGSNFLLTGDIGATGTRITKGWFTDLQVTNAIAGSVTGNAATLTVADEASDTTCFIGFYTAATGSLPGKTNANLTFNSNTGVLTSGTLNSTSLTGSEIVITDVSKNLVSAPVATYPSLTELTYLKGVSSAIQTQFSGKEPTITTLSLAKGGLGQDSSGVADGQIPIGNDAGNSFTLANITAGSNILVTNGAGAITISSTVSGGGATGRIYYPQNSQASDLTGYKVASTTPSSGATNNITIVCPTQNAYVLGEEFATASGEPNTTSLPAGTAVRYLFASITGGTGQIKVDLFQYKTTGNIATTGAVSLTYNENGASADTITRGAGSFITDGFTNGCKITVTGTVNNNGTYTVQTVAALTLTLILSDDLTAETVSSTITTKEKLLRSGLSPVFTNTTSQLIQFFYSDSSAYSLATDDRIVFKWWGRKTTSGASQTITIGTEGTTSTSYIQTTLPVNLGIAQGTSLQLSNLTASEIVITDTNKNLVSAAVATYPSLTELTYVKGVTSALQTQLNDKASTALSNLASVAINTTLVSDTDNTDDLGTTAKKWANLFVTNVGATATRITKLWSTDIESTNIPTVGGTAILTSLTAPQFTTIELGHASDTTISRSSAGVLAVEGVVIPSISSTNTLTNKRITKRTGTTTSSATPTINTDNVDFYSLTAQAEAITSMTTNLSGTPTEGQTLWIAITGTAARAITWGTSFEASTIALPTTTVSTNRLDVGFVWNTVTSKWRCVATC